MSKCYFYIKNVLSQEYALVRLKAYQEQKEFLQKAYPFLLQTDKHMKDGEI